MASLKTVPKNDILFMETEPVDFFFIVKQGLISLYKTSEDGRELVIRKMGPGDYFCCAPLYEGGRHYVSARVVKDAELIMIPAEEFKGLMMGGMSEMGTRMIASLCARIRYLSQMVEDLTFKNVEQRILVAFWRLAEEKAPGADIVDLAVTHQDIASMIGTVREVVSRIMLKLKKNGVITRSSVKGFTIDRNRLLSLLRQS